MLKAQLKYPNKILLITDLYPINDFDKIPLAVENFAIALKEYGFDITIIKPNFLFNSIIRKRKFYKDGIYYRNDIKIYNKNFFLPFIFNSFKPLEEFDLIISHMPSGNIYADLLNKKLNLPRISIVHNSDFRVLSNFKYSFYFKKRLLKALENSNLIGARNFNLQEKFNADFILPSFIDEKVILNKKTAQEKLKIITISNLIKRKNIDMVINALSKLNCDFEYGIYGDGVEKNKLKSLVKKHNLEDKITFHGAIDHNLICEKLDKSDIFILPSTNETFGLCYIEAMARGLIVIAKHNESMDGILENNKNGFLVESSFDIKNVLENLNFNKKQEIINNTLENIKNFEKEKIISKYIETIGNCVNIKKCNKTNQN